MFQLPLGVTGDQSDNGPNPIAAALAAPAPATPASEVPASTPPASGGGLLAALGLGGGGTSTTSTGMGNPIGNALVNSGGHFLLPLLGRLMGGTTPSEQLLAQRQAATARANAATALGFNGLDDALQAANGNHNKAIHSWLKTPTGIAYFANGGKMDAVKTYLDTASPDPSKTLDDFETELQRGGVDAATAKQLAYKNKVGLIKVIPRTVIDSAGNVSNTGQYDVIDLTTNQTIPVGQKAAAASVPPPPSATTAPATPTVAPAATGPAPNAGVAAPPAGGAVAPTTAAPVKKAVVIPYGADIAATEGPVGTSVQVGGSLASNVNPKLFPQKTTENENKISQIEADSRDLITAYKQGRSGKLLQPLQDLMNIGNSKSPQEAVNKMISARSWIDDQISEEQAVLNNPAQPRKERENAQSRLNALNKAVVHLPPMKTATYTGPDGNPVTVIGLEDELKTLNNAGVAGGPTGQYLKDAPDTLQKYVDTGRQILNQGMDEAGLPTAKHPQQGPQMPQFKTLGDLTKAFEGGKVKVGDQVQYYDADGNLHTATLGAKKK